MCASEQKFELKCGKSSIEVNLTAHQLDGIVSSSGLSHVTEMRVRMDEE